MTVRLLGWAAAIVTIVVLLLFALIGIQTSFRDTPVSAVRVVRDGGGGLPFADSTHRASVAALAGVPLHAGNQVELLLNGDGTFPRLWADIRGARQSVTLRLYFILPGAVAESLRAALEDRARAGVPVFLLYDAYGSDFRDGYLEQLRAAGVRVAPFRPIAWHTIARAQNRSHTRAVTIDGRIGYTGGFGIDDRWLGDGRTAGEWRETNVRFTGPAVTQLQAAFVAGWAEATGTLLSGPPFFPSPTPSPTGPHAAGLLHTAPAAGSTEAERFLALSIASAARTLYVTNAYFVPDDDLRRFLVGAARRGVDVRVLTASRHTDMPIARLAGRRRYEALLRAGVRIYEYRPSMVHAKTMTVDGVWATVGTMNFDNRSAALNEETNLIVYDRELGARLDSIFLDDLRAAREIRIEPFRDRPWYDRILEFGAAALTRLL